MALNFPNSPTNGQLYTDTLSGNSWTYDSANTCWKSTSTYIQTITVSSSAPGTPAVGQLWWNRDYGRLLVYYSDGDTSQWVDASPSDYTSQLAYNQANAVSIVANNAFANTSGTFNGNLTISGNVIANKQVTVTYTPAASVNAAITLAAANTQGGTGYADFMKVTNLSGGATNPNKTFRLNSTGGIEIINSAYSAVLMSLTDAGYLSLPYIPCACVSLTTSNADDSADPYTWASGPIRYDQIRVNNGSVYNSSTGRFTAPVAGYYRFSTNFLKSSSQATTYYRIYKNGSYISTGGYSSASGYNNMVTDDIVYMAANDYLTAQLGGGGININASNGDWWQSTVFHLLG